MEQLTFKTQEFEGPLDLMLYLIQKHKLDICDISISSLLEQYMEYIRERQMRDLEVASAFLEMASRLVYIKTVMLLPKHEEALRLKEELQGQLLEYHVCRLVASRLGERGRRFLQFVRRPTELDIDSSYRLTHPAGELYSAYHDAVGRGKRRLPPPARAFSGIVERRIVSVGSRIVFILKKLYKKGRSSYESLFSSSENRGELVATFLAMLELVKAKRITVDGGEVRFLRARQKRDRTAEVTE